MAIRFIARNAFHFLVTRFRDLTHHVVLVRLTGTTGRRQGQLHEPRHFLRNVTSAFSGSLLTQARRPLTMYAAAIILHAT